jgi:hypothetical protein
MYDVAPEEILNRIGAAYERAIARAVERYPQWAADEEYASGAVGGTMEELVKGQATIDGQTYRWNTTTWAVRGKGPRSPETEYGADAVIDIVLRDEHDNTIASKILPVQNKKERIYSARKLAQQSRRLSRLPGGGLVVSFSERGFTSCEAGVVADAAGRWKAIPDDLKTNFGRALADDFLRCKVGSRDISYDMRRQVFRTSDGQEIRLPVRRRIRTLIKRSGGTRQRSS